MKPDEKKKKSESLYLIARRVALITAIFGVILSILMIVNTIQTKSIDPLNSKALSQLMEQLKQDPENTALREQIRAIDLLARKAYFTYQWQVRTGSYLLFAFILIFLLAMKYMSSLQKQLPDLSESPEDATWEDKLLSRRGIVFGGIALFLFAFVLSILTENDLSSFTGSSSDGERVQFDTQEFEIMRDQWPGFRGPGGIGIAYHTDVPTEWDGESGKNILWKTLIPKSGFNSPVIWGDKIFLSGADKKTQEIYCIASETGEIVWTASLNDIPGSPSEKPKISGDTGYAAPTMSTDGERIFAIFATGDIACYDFQGNRIWTKNLGVPENHYGHSSSLISYGGLILIQYDQNTGGRLIALRAESGDPVYDTPRDAQISWASPILVNTGQRAELILNSNPSVISYDPMTGKELWKVECMMGEVAPSPAFADGMVYAVNEYARLVGIKLGDTAEIAWEFEDDLSEVSSPVASEDYLFVAASWGTVSCFNSKTGERYWYHDFDEGFYSSPVLVGDHVYLMDMFGVMTIFKADREFQLVGSYKLGERAVTVPAFMHNRIYIRGVKHLFCIGK